MHWFVKPDVFPVNIVLTGDVAGENQNNNNAALQLESCEPASFTDSDSDQDADSDNGGLVDSRPTEDVAESSLKIDLSSASDASPRRKKRKKSLERLTQIRQEEVNSAPLFCLLLFSFLIFLIKVALDRMVYKCG